MLYQNIWSLCPSIHNLSTNILWSNISLLCIISVLDAIKWLSPFETQVLLEFSAADFAMKLCWLTIMRKSSRQGHDNSFQCWNIWWVLSLSCCNLTLYIIFHFQILNKNIELHTSSENRNCTGKKQTQKGTTIFG